MRTIKKITSCILLAAMTLGIATPAENVNAVQVVVGYGAEETVVKSDQTAQETSQPISTDGTASTEQTTGETASTEQTTGETASTEQTTGETASTEQTTGQTASTEQTTGETASTEQTTDGTASMEQTTDGTASTEQATEEITAKNSDLVVSELSPAASKVIVLDPGHCTKHPGASGNGLREEDAVLDIAEGCEDALNAYGDVTVYMTREDGTCPSSNGLGDDLKARNNYAKLLDADFLVSLHLNAGSSSGANALVAYQSGYHDNIRKETQEFGKIALAKLNKLGITNRGFLLRKSASYRYSNGSRSDYYSIVRMGVVQNIPSVIMENGYITSSSDVSKFFKTKTKRRKVGEADADAIAEYYNLNKEVIPGTFQEIDGVNYFVQADGRKVTGWVKEEGDWYYFDETDGRQVKGFVTIGEDTFYLSPADGSMLSGYFTVNGKRYLARGNGTLVKNQMHSDGVHQYLFDGNGRQLKKGFHKIDGYTYYVNSKKNVVTGTQKIGGKYYLFELETGHMLYGLQKENKKYYYTDPTTGVLAIKKIVEINGARYYFGSSGVRETGWVTYKKNKYYFNKKNGKMLTGWRKINKRYYYFDKKTGKMQKSKWIGNYYVNASGVRTRKKK